MNNDLSLDSHISRSFNEELEEVRHKALVMGGLVEKQVTDGLTALLKLDSKLGEVVAGADFEINAMEVAIDEQCTQILARRQPAATDLRLIISIIKTITDLERIGDEAEKLGRYAITLENKKIIPSYFVTLRHLGEHVKIMLHNALDAFAHNDVEEALTTIASDEQINYEFEAISRQLITQMMEDPRDIKDAMQISWCARALERIGDHSKNICEYVVYLVKGKDVRHTSFEKLKHSVNKT
jgi:phosphate transport system protein